MAGAPRGLDLTFLSEQEARQIVQVLERDAELKRAEKDRISKLQKKKQDVTGLQGVTGEWFEEIQRKKFRNEIDVNRMLKRPLAHWLRKTSRTDPKEFKMSSPQNPQAQKNVSPSILGFRTPFASLFSFKKSRKHTLKHQTRQQPRYDSFALGAHTSSKVEEMAQAETCNSSLPAELPGNLFDATQAEMMEDSTPIWNEQLEKEFFRVLGDLDDQLAQEQAQDSVNRKRLDDSGPRAQYLFPSTSRQTAIRGRHRNNCSETPSTFFSDATRTIRAKEDHKIFYRPRKFYDTYMNRCHSASKEEYMHKDSLDSSYPVLSRRLSSVSFGESSEGSLHLPSIRQNSGFGHKSYMGKGTVGRSYSVCSLQRYPSSASSEPFSTTSLQNLLATENNSGFVRRNNRQTPKRIPLSSIVWNKPYTSGHASNQDNLFRTQSLMECNATKQDTYPCPLHKNREYEFYRSKHHYRRAVSSTNWFSSISCTDKAATSLSFDNWENYPLCRLENNLSRSHYRDTACHGRFQIHQKSSPFGRKEEHPSWSDIYQYYNDEVFLSPDAHYEMITSNLNDQQSAHAKNAKLASQCHHSDFQTCVSENRSSMEVSSGASSKLLSKNSKDPQSYLTYKSAVTSTNIKADVSESVLLGSRFKKKLVAENSSSVTKVSQSQPQPLVTQMNIKKDFKKAASDKVRDLELSGKADQKSIKDIILQPVSQKMDTKNTIDPQISPSNNTAALQNSTSLLNSPLSLSSRRQTQLTATREITKNNISKSCKRNLQRKENDLPAHSELNQAPSLLSADGSRRGSFLSNLKQWEHHLLNSAKRKGIKLGSRRAETTDHITPKGESFQVDILQSNASVHSAPITETLANHQSILPSPPELLSRSSQGSLQAFSHKSYLKSLETPTNSSVNCRVTEAPAEGGEVVELVGVVAKDIPQEKPKDQNILASKDHNSQLTTGGSQNRNCENIYACSFDRGPEIAERSLNYFCLERENGKTRQNTSCIERLYRQGSLLRHTNSSSISGSPGKSNPESPEPRVIYYTLPRKSASIAGSVMSDMSISFPKSKTATWDHVEKQNSDRTAAFSFNQGDKISSLGSAHSSIRPIPLDGITDIKENVLQIKDCPLPLNRSPSHSLSGSTVVSESEREKLVNQKESPVFSDCLEKEMGDSLQKYKTISTFTVSGDEDHVEYHELVSIYYTLPRSHSRTLCNLFLDDPEITALPLYTEKSKSPKMRNKNSEVRIGLANVAFPSTLEKERHPHSPDQTPAASMTPQNAKTGAVDTDQESSHFSPSTENVCTSQSTSIVHNKKDISPGLALKESTLVLPDMVTSDTSIRDPESTAEADTSVKAISTASHNQNIDICFSSGKESKEKENILHTDTPLTSTLSTATKHKGPPENVFNFTSAINTNSVQNRDSKNCQQFIKVRGSNNQNILPPQLDKNSSHEGKSHRESAVNNTPITSAESKSRHDAGAKERSDFQHQSISLYNNKCTGFLLGAESSRNSTDEELISDRKMLPNSQNKPFQLGTVSAAKPILQPAKIGIPDTHDLVSRKTKQEQISLNTQMDKDCTSLQKAVMSSEDRQNVESKDKLSSVTQDLQLLQSAVSENKLMSDGTREKVSDIEKRKNRPSVKNEVAAIYKTSRKFCSKNVNPKPHVSNIFSQNDGGITSLEINMTHNTLHSPASTQLFLQTGNEDQNQNLTPGVCDSPVHKISEKNKRSQTNDDSPLLVKNQNQGPFANSCNQRREVNNPKQNENEVESMLSPTTLFPKEIAARSKNSPKLVQGLENRNQTIFSRATETDSSGNQKRTSTGSSHDPLLLPFLTDKNSNTFITNLQASVCSQKQALSPDECDHDQNLHRSKSLKNANLHSNQSRMSHAKNQRERHFSESTYTQDSHDNLGSGSNCLPKKSRYSRKFKSYSELCSCDENENWASYDRTTTYGTRRVMYPSIEFGIFGKEQQLAFLENIKRSLTEGRLWRPCLLKNPGFLRNEESDSLKRAELLNSSSARSKMSVDASSPRDPIDIYREEPMVYSDSDTDTTTDDEYYLCETDKESEL
ncbi:protein O-glucosyltransferase 3 isoform X1 [Trachemys scripta elegans]|uniref:protein O-glucosyltransferase 3 isoform X1 n=2 Tax=Trachemys scripta elegans TaxID=31138 RepID=UPI00155392B5|nr:protein O-glucosyltransferase 3 isoform X1 [Trachemys scripta elegans]